MYEVLGIIVYFTIGLLLAKGYTVHKKIPYKDMNEDNQVFIVAIIFFYPIVVIVLISLLFGKGIERVLNKVL